MSKTFQPDSLHPYIMDARLKKATGSGGISNIPIASADTLGGIKVPADSGITIDGSGNAYIPKPINYSTEEQKTGHKDIDGKDIYSKSYTVNALPNATEASFNHNISNIYRLVKLYGSAQNSGKTTFFPLPYVAQENFAGCIKLSMNATQISIWAGSDRRNLSAIITVEYTKADPTPEETTP